MTGKATGRSRRSRAIAAEQPELMDMVTEEDTIETMDLFFPVLYDAVSNFFNTFTSSYKRVTTKPTTMPPQMTTTTLATTTTPAPHPQNNPQLQKFVPFFFPHLKLNPMQQALANQIVASIAHYGQQIASAFIQNHAAPEPDTAAPAPVTAAPAPVTATPEQEAETEADTQAEPELDDYQ